jgi:hypothetical protein
VIVICGGAISRGLLRAAPGRLIALGQRFGAERRLLLLGDEQPLELDRIGIRDAGIRLRECGVQRA